MLYPVTLNAIRKHLPCKAGWEKLLAQLGKTKADDEPLLLSTILASNGLDDALWCLRALDDKAVIVEIACLFAEEVLPVFEEAHPNDTRPREAIRMAREIAAGRLPGQAGQAARAAAGHAARAAADAAGHAARAAAEAAGQAAGQATRTEQRKRQAQILIEACG